MLSFPNSGKQSGRHRFTLTDTANVRGLTILDKKYHQSRNHGLYLVLTLKEKTATAHTLASEQEDESSHPARMCCTNLLGENAVTFLPAETLEVSLC